jgi:hypothetical protein
MTASARDERPTADIVRVGLLRDRAAAYRQAADELHRLADEMEREARDGAYIASVAARADRALLRAPRGGMG